MDLADLAQSKWKSGVQKRWPRLKVVGEICKVNSQCADGIATNEAREAPPPPLHIPH